MAAQKRESNANDQIEERKVLKRRGILAAAGAAVAGIMAKQMAEPVAAADVFSIPGEYTYPASVFVWKINNNSTGDAIIGNASTRGVFGFATGTGGTGVGGTATSGNGTGVQGLAAGDTSTNTTGFPIGVRGSIPNTGYGVYGNAGNGAGVYGTATGGYGVYGVAVSGNGVVGSTSGAGNVAGLYGTSSTTYGIIGNTTAKGYSGLTGITSTPGVAALAASSTTTAAFAAYFSGTTVVEGDLYVVKHPDGTGGGKFAAVAHADGSYRGVYCTESPEPWFEDFGMGKLSGNMADVTLDPEFAALIHTDDYHVFITPRGDFHAHIAQQTPTGFRVAMTTVGAVQGTTSAVGEQTFSWRVVGKRKDIAGTRLPKVDLPKIKTPDPNNLPRFEPPKNKP